MTDATTPPEAAPIAGSTSEAPWQHPWKAWKTILKRVYIMDSFHHSSLMAAGVAFYAFLSFVPLLGAIVMTYGLFGDPATVAGHMQTVIDLVPRDAAKLIQDQLLNVTTAAKGKVGLGLIIALAFSIYGAMRASSALIQTLNVIYEEEEGRSIFRIYWLSAKITIGAVVAGVTGLVAAGLLGYLQQAANVLGEIGVIVIQAATWIVATLIASTAFGYAYRYGPDRRHAQWQWLSVGAVIATLLWLLATVLFGVYVANFANYNATYGSLGAVVILLMWMWVSTYAILIGAEINAEAERQTSVDSTIGRVRPMGERGATVADKLPAKHQKRPRRDAY